MVFEICNSLFSGSQCIFCDFIVMFFFSLYFTSHGEFTVFTQHFANDRPSVFLPILLLFFGIFSAWAKCQPKKRKEKKKERNCCTCNWNRTANGILRFNNRISLVGNHKQNIEHKITNYSQNVMAKNSRR